LNSGQLICLVAPSLEVLNPKGLERKAAPNRVQLHGGGDYFGDGRGRGLNVIGMFFAKADWAGCLFPAAFSWYLSAMIRATMRALGRWMTESSLLRCSVCEISAFQDPNCNHLKSEGVKVEICRGIVLIVSLVGDHAATSLFLEQGRL
jgi:hypothetical protein